MSKNKTKSALTALSMAMLLVACNGNDDDPVGAKSLAKSTTPTLKTLTVTPSLGKILNAKVKLKNAANNAPIGEQNTGSTGKATFTIPSTVSTVIAEVQGGNGAQYFDEATGQMVDLPLGAIIRAATTIVANNSEIGVTALTEAAVKRAETLAGTGSIVPQLNAAKAQIEAAFGVADILKAPTLVGSQQELAALGSSAAEQYALRLATLAKVAQQQLGTAETAPALKLAQAIANDLADGNINGSGNTGALPYDVATFASQYQAQALKLIQDFIASASQNGFDAVKLQALLSFVQSNPLTIKTYIPPAQILHQNARFTANFDHCHRNLPDKLGRYGDSCTASSVRGQLESLGNNGTIINSVKLPAVYPLGHFCTVSFSSGRLTITSDIPYEDGSGNFLGGTAKLSGDNEDTIIALSADNNAKVIYIGMRDSLGGISNLSAGGEIWIDDAGNLTYASAYYGRNGVSCGYDAREN